MYGNSAVNNTRIMRSPPQTSGNKSGTVALVAARGSRGVLPCRDVSQIEIYLQVVNVTNELSPLSVNLPMYSFVAHVR